MVVIVVKKSEKDQFLAEASCSESNDVLIRRLVKIWNMRIKTELLCGAVEELASYGPSKPDALKGIDSIQDQAQISQGGSAPDRGPTYTPDPSGNRTGEAPSAQMQAVLRKVVEDARQSISAAQVKNKVALSVDLLEEKLATIRGAVTMAYPQGLPKYDPVRIALEDTEHCEDIYGESMLDPATAELWLASKPFDRSQTVADRVGKNEKTKVVVKLQKPGAGPPAREPAVSEEERKQMMAHYFRKQEEMKKLAENSAEDYLNSSWADPSALRRQLNGTGSIRFR